MAHDPHDIDWRALLDRHDADPDDDFPGWREALDVLDADPEAQAEAEVVDPLMIFRRLPEPEVGADDIAAMKQAVASARRARAVEEVSADPLDEPAALLRFDRLRDLAPRRPARWFAAAAAVVLAVGGFWSLDDAVLDGSVHDGAFEPPRVAAGPVAPMASPVARSLPLVEAIGASPSEMMQVDTDDLSLVVVYVGPPTANDVLSPDDA